MLTAILLAIGVVIFDRAIPMNAWRFSVKALEVSREEYMRRYGIVRFPRTMFAVLIVVVPIIAEPLNMDRTVQGLVAVPLTILFVTSAGIDSWRAAKSV